MEEYSLLLMNKLLLEQQIIPCQQPAKPIRNQGHAAVQQR